MIPLLPTKTADTAYMGIFCKCDQALSKFNYSSTVQLFQVRLVGVAFYACIPVLGLDGNMDAGGEGRWIRGGVR